MTDNQFDDLFRKKLLHHESGVPGDLWDKIERRKDRPRRRFGFWLTTAAIVLITGSLGSYLLLKHQHAGGPATATRQQEKMKANENNTTNNKTENDRQNSTPSNKDIATSDKNSRTGTTTGEAGQTTVQHGSKQLNANKTATPLLQHAQTGNDGNKAGAGKPEPGQVNNIAANAGGGQDKQPAGNPVAAENPSSNIQPQTGGQPVATDTTVNKTAEAATENTGGKSEPTLSDIIAGGLSKKKEKKYREPRQQFLEVFASPDLNFRQVSAAPGFEDYANEKSKAEKRAISFSAGLRFTQMLGEHFYIKTGIQFTQIREQFSYHGQSEYRVIPVTVARTLPTSSGNVYNLSTSMYGQWGYKIIESSNRYSSFEIPVLAGYQTNGPTLRAFVNAGVLVGISTSYHGYTIDSTYKAVPVSESGLYKANMGASLYLGAGLIKDMSAHFSLFAEPYLRYRLGSMTVSEKPIRQRLHGTGLMIGLKYKF